MIAFVKLLQEKEIPRPFCSQDACLAVVSPRELSDRGSSVKQLWRQKNLPLGMELLPTRMA